MAPRMLKFATYPGDKPLLLDLESTESHYRTGPGRRPPPSSVPSGAPTNFIRNCCRTGRRCSAPPWRRSPTVGPQARPRGAGEAATAPRRWSSASAPPRPPPPPPRPPPPLAKTTAQEPLAAPGVRFAPGVGRVLPRETAQQPRSAPSAPAARASGLRRQAASLAAPPLRELGGGVEWGVGARAASAPG